MSTVVVAYATRNGATQRVAERIAGVLRERGAHVEFQRARDARLSIDVDLLVLGAPLYSGRWHRDAHRFLKRCRRMPMPTVAVFGMGPRNDDAEAWALSRAQLDRALAKHEWLAPAAVAVFGGVDPPGKKAHRDLRDWSAIGSWAESLIE